MKKIISVTAITLVLIMSLCSCSFVNMSSKEPSNDTGTKQETKKTAEYERGSWEGDTYTNKFIGISFKKPENWEIATEDEILNMMNLGKELLTDKQKLMAEMSMQKTIYDTVISLPEKGSSIMVAAENLSMTLGGSAITEEKYINILKEELKKVDTLSYKFGDSREVTIADKKYKTLEAEIEGADLKQTYYCYKMDKYLITFIVTYSDDTNETINNFFAGVEKAE